MLNGLLEAFYENLKKFHPETKLLEEKIGSIIFEYLKKILIKESSGILSNKQLRDYAQTFINDLNLKPKKFIHIYEIIGIDLEKIFTLNDEFNFSEFIINDDATLKFVAIDDFKEINDFAGFYGTKRIIIPKVVLVIKKNDFSGKNISNLAERIRELLQIYYLTDIAFGNRYTFVKSMTYPTVFHTHKLSRRITGGSIILKKTHFDNFKFFTKNILPKLLEVYTNSSKEFLKHSINRYCRAMDSSTPADSRLLYSVLALEPLFIKEFEGKEIMKNPNINITTKVKERVVQFGRC